MTKTHGHKRRGFSLTELAIVLGVIGILMGAIWGYAISARQSAKVEQSNEEIALLVDDVRSAYGGQASIGGGVSTVVPNLVKIGAMPAPLMRYTASLCSGVSSNYADTPWGGTADVCGTLRLCAWTSGTNTACGAPSNPASAQFFAIEFTQLTYGSCGSLAERVSPSLPPGLADVYINGISAVSNGGLPVTPSFATGQGAYAGKGCTANSSANVIDFVYKLRAPVS